MVLTRISSKGRISAVSSVISYQINNSLICPPSRLWNSCFCPIYYSIHCQNHEFLCFLFGQRDLLTMTETRFFGRRLGTDACGSPPSFRHPWHRPPIRPTSAWVATATTAAAEAAAAAASCPRNGRQHTCHLLLRRALSSSHWIREQQRQEVKEQEDRPTTTTTTFIGMPKGNRRRRCRRPHHRNRLPKHRQQALSSASVCKRWDGGIDTRKHPSIL